MDKLEGYNQIIFGNFQIFGNNYTDGSTFDSTNAFPVPTKTYDKFSKNEELCDIFFVLEAEDIPLHKKIIIARNEVFAKTFTTDMLEKETNRVKIKDIKPKNFKLKD